MNPKTKKALKITGITLGSIIGLCILTIGSYVTYVLASYSRLGDQDITVNKRIEKATIETNKELTYTSYNIGFGAYEPNYNFFLDKGIDPDGTIKTGHYSKGLSKENTMANTLGATNVLKTLNSDFIAVQEVDIDSDRAYHINQQKEIEKVLTDYDTTFANNFHSSFLAYPFYDMHGASEAGLLTLSKYNIQTSKRKELTISDGFDKFFDLDRCYSVNYIDVDNGHKLCLINIHMSAYDEGGYIRNAQVKQFKTFVDNEVKNGNYVIAAGDYNHDLLTFNPLYKNKDGSFKYTMESHCFKEIYKQKFPYWAAQMHNEDGTNPFGDNFTVYADNKVPTMRGCDQNYKQGFTYVTTVDGFVVSDNVEFISVDATKVPREGVSDMYGYSDHQPTTLRFKLK